MLSAVILSALGYPAFTIGIITGTPAVRPSRSSRTKEGSSQYSHAYIGYGPNCLTNSEPSSRTALMGEQPNPWDVLPPQVAMSRHRGAKPPRRCELLGEISLLS